MTTQHISYCLIPRFFNGEWFWLEKVMITKRYFRVANGYGVWRTIGIHRL